MLLLVWDARDINLVDKAAVLLVVERVGERIYYDVGGVQYRLSFQDAVNGRVRLVQFFEAVLALLIIQVLFFADSHSFVVLLVRPDYLLDRDHPDILFLLVHPLLFFVHFHMLVEVLHQALVAVQAWVEVTHE